MGSKVWSLCGWKKRMDSPKKSLILAYYECSFRTRFQLPEVKSTTWDEKISIPDSKCHYMIYPTNHDSCRFLFCIFELFLSHFNAQLNHFPSVDAMLHRCKALPEALLSRTCTVLGSAECSCEVVQSQSWSRVIVVSAAIDFSVVQLFLHIFSSNLLTIVQLIGKSTSVLGRNHPAGPV